MTRPFAQVDVFTTTALGGNPVAVVLDGTGLDTETMHAFARWTNLSETTFVLPPSNPNADYRLRIFTPERELDFAGHPTLGSAHAWLAAGGSPKAGMIVQECGIGLVTIRRDGDTLSFAAPDRRRSGPLSAPELDRLVTGLGLPADAVLAHEWCDNGPPWQSLLLDSAERVLAVQPDARALEGCFVGVIGAHGSEHDAAYEVRAFFPAAHGMGEDPVTGSLNAALGQWLIEVGIAPQRYTAAQGTALGRRGRVRVERIDGQVWVGGASVTVLEGTATL